jgi:hypothetical protein
MMPQAAAPLKRDYFVFEPMLELDIDLQQRCVACCCIGGPVLGKCTIIVIF